MRDAVVAVRSQPLDAGEFGEPARGTASGEDGNKVDGLRDQRARDRYDSFLNELFGTAQCADAGARVDGADAAGAAGAPGVELVEGFRAAHPADGGKITRQSVGSGRERLGVGDECGGRGNNKKKK